MTSPSVSTQEQLANSQLLRDIPPQALADLAKRVTRRSLRSGDRLCDAGDVGASAFLVVSGRFRAEAGGRTIGEIGRGELVGEVSLLTGQPRSATVTALRDSEVLELDSGLFNEVLARYPGCYQAVSRQLVERLQRVLTTTAVSRATVVTVLHDGRPASRATVDRFAELIGEPAAVVSTETADVGALETANDVVVIAPEPDEDERRRWALGQCDRALLVVDAGTGPGEVRALAAEGDIELVLVHPATMACPSNTRRWLDTLEPVGHHHVRAGNTADLSRVVRRLRGAENVLVLSGGGARGLAHAGLYRALVEHGVAVDAVAGVSAGAVAAAIIAMGLAPDEAARVATRLFSAGGSPVDLTIPTIALASGVRMNDRLKELCDEHRTLEDLWLPATFVSANLTTNDLHLHQRGSLWRALRASTAIPGVFPPVAEPAGLLVDGGVVANLPVDLARQLHPGATVIASDVGKKMELLPDDFPANPEVKGWEAVRSRVRNRDSLPGMVRILAQVTALGGAGSAQGQGDLHLEFELDQFGMFDFKKGQAIVEAGYEQASAPVEAFARRIAVRETTGPVSRGTA